MAAETTPGKDEEGLASLGSLAGGLAHEIKNPLSTMTITLGLLREDMESGRGEPGRALRRVKVLEREVARLEEILVQTSVRGGAVRLDVTDTGPGIHPKMLPRIFEAYFSTKKTGTGLGLPIARRIVEEHGGILEVFTEQGKGTRFTMWFPVTAAVPAGEGGVAP